MAAASEESREVLMEQLEELALVEQEVIEEQPLTMGELESTVLGLTKPYQLENQAVNKLACLKLYTGCPAGCDILVKKDEGGRPKWEGVFCRGSARPTLLYFTCQFLS